METREVPQFDYELCEKCEQAMKDAGLFGMTTQEMYETDSQFYFDLGLNLMWQGNYIVREVEKEKDSPKVIMITVPDGCDSYKFAKMDLATDKIISFVELTTEDILAADWTIAKVNEIKPLEEQLEELEK